MPMLSLLLVSGDDDRGLGLLIIAGTVLLVVLAIAAVWTFAARRADRVPRRTPQRPDQGVRDSN